MKYLLWTGLVAFSNMAGAAQGTAVPDPLSLQTLARVFGSLGLILLLIFALVWLIRRSGAGIRVRGGKMKVIDALSLGQRERLVLVAVEDQHFLLGVSPGRVQAIESFKGEEFVGDSPNPSENFSQALQRIKSRSNRSDRRSDEHD